MKERKYDSVFEDEASADDLKNAKKNFWIKMKRFAGKVPFAKDATALFYLVKDPRISLSVKSTAVLALLYFISPVDLIPDTIPLAGFLDDAGVIAAAISMIGPLLTPYKERADDWFAKGADIPDDDDSDEEIKDAEVV